MLTHLLAAVNPMNGSSLLSAFGALAVLVVTFAESGLLIVGFFLPGDTLLFPAGVLCAAPAAHGGTSLALWQVLLGAAVGTCLGSQLGFLIGRRGGVAMLARSRSARLKSTVAHGEELLARYGQRKAIFIGRFIPLVRTVLGPVAGVLQVPTRTFTVWQVAGGVVWSQSLVLLGYWLGAAIPGVDNYLLPLVALVVLVSFLPVLLERRRKS
ncbi:DedA family protein [Streptacidiphilus neutrinimicus]|uniref:DedA family protein n=1 Tax=Streptacidiphilus neutrinimicus TaxID=105420 RepID=UPI000A6FFDFD